jgi:hypothetical protein|tara:strand:+ start:2932 stop:3153 length:222 start_codon:yes stop_codon:yes gene_type:complete
MKSYFQGIITGGVFVFAVMVLMGASEPKPELGKYQISSTGMVDGFNIYEVVINTKTGNVIRRDHIRSEYYKTP